jgi:hypothetical protein
MYREKENESEREMKKGERTFFTLGKWGGEIEDHGKKKMSGM